MREWRSKSLSRVEHSVPGPVQTSVGPANTQPASRPANTQPASRSTLAPGVIAAIVLVPGETLDTAGRPTGDAFVENSNNRFLRCVLYIWVCRSGG